MEVELKVENKGYSAVNQSKREMIFDVMTLFHEFRFNTIKEKPEYIKKVVRSKGKEVDPIAKFIDPSDSASKSYLPVDNFFINSLVNQVELRGIKTSAVAVKSILESDFVPKVNPIQDYFRNLSKGTDRTGGHIYHFTEGDYIKELCDTVTVKPNKAGGQAKEQEEFLTYFKKWIVGAVANALDDYRCLNHVCLVLTGSQGTFKTTWLNHLCPKELVRHYLYCGKIEPNNKDAQTLIAEYFLINIDDQLKQLNRKDENDLKEMITKPKVSYRRPYAAYMDEYPHIASFCASVNGNDFLTDPTGNRRFLPFEVDKIDIKAAQKLNMDNVYRQALYLLSTDFVYWISEDEVEALNDRNTKFQVSSVEEELLIRHFKLPEEKDILSQTFDFRTKSDILSYIGSANKSVRLNDKRLSAALDKMGFKRKQRRIDGKQVWGYDVMTKGTEDYGTY